MKGANTMTYTCLLYTSGKRYENKIEHFGNQRSYQPEAPLIL